MQNGAWLNNIWLRAKTSVELKIGIVFSISFSGWAGHGQRVNCSVGSW